MAEYGNTDSYQESGVFAPTTEYGRSKLVISKWVKIQDSDIRENLCVARLFGVYGPGEAAYRLFPSLIASLEKGQAVDLSDGTQKRDFIHVDDVCDYLYRIATLKSLPDFVDLGTGEAIEIKTLCLWIAQSLGKETELLNFGARARSPGDADVYAANTTSILKVFGSVPPQRLMCKGVDIKSLFIA